MIIYIDTREQLPYQYVHALRKKLEVGDYTTSKLYNKFHIERKTLQDLYGTLVQGNGRFKYELWRAAWHRITIVVYAEGSRADFIAKNFPKGNERKFSSHGLDQLIKTFERKYHLSFTWCHSRQHSKKMVQARLENEESAFLARKRGKKL